MLITEGNKLLRKGKSDQARAQERRGTSAGPPPESPHDLFAEQEEGTKEQGIIPQAELPQQNPATLQEKECVRLLIQYSNFELELTHTLCKYIFDELKDDFLFRKPVYKKIIGLFREALSRDKVLDTNFFLNHDDAEIKEAAIDLLMNPHQLSDGWKSKNIEVPMEIDNLPRLAYENILRLKNANNTMTLNVIMEELKSAINEEEEIRLQRTYVYYLEIKKKIAGEFGTVVSSI
jgi:DNA primase